MKIATNVTFDLITNDQTGQDNLNRKFYPFCGDVVPLFGMKRLGLGGGFRCVISQSITSGHNGLTFGLKSRE